MHPTPADTATDAPPDAPRAASARALLRTDGLTKTFGETRACDAVSIALGEGEIVALLGENGAGKSTLVKMLFGALQPDAGTIEWRGGTVAIPEPAAARALGIGLVHQHFSLFEAFTVAENIALGLGGDARPRRIAGRARETSRAYGLPLDPDALVADLSIGERQRVEIVRCLMQDPALVIMDEPTSVLTPGEAEGLFETLRALRAEGRTVLYISHKLEEVRALCDRAIVMRAGRVVGEYDPARETAASLAAAMMGRDVVAIRPREHAASDEVALALNALSRDSERPFGADLRGIELRVRRGEIVGIAGMAGNGQDELFAAVSGEDLAPDADDVTMFGRAVGRDGIDARRALGAAFVPEERLGHAAVPSLDLADNALLSRHARADGTVGALGRLARAVARIIADRVNVAMDVRKSVPNPVAGALSGGNLQKFVVGRELDGAPRLLVVAQPTWGVDAGAAAAIRQALLDLAAGGAAVLVLSQDLDELLEIADRIAVIREGRLGEARETARVTRESIGLEMGGASGGGNRLAA